MDDKIRQCDDSSTGITKLTVKRTMKDFFSRNNNLFSLKNKNKSKKKNVPHQRCRNKVDQVTTTEPSTKPFNTIVPYSPRAPSRVLPTISNSLSTTNRGKHGNLTKSLSDSGVSLSKTHAYGPSRRVFAASDSSSTGTLSDSEWSSNSLLDDNLTREKLLNIASLSCEKIYRSMDTIFHDETRDFVSKSLDLSSTSNLSDVSIMEESPGEVDLLSTGNQLQLHRTASESDQKVWSRVLPKVSMDRTASADHIKFVETMKHGNQQHSSSIQELDVSILTKKSLTNRDSLSNIRCEKNDVGITSPLKTRKLHKKLQNLEKIDKINVYLSTALASTSDAGISRESAHVSANKKRVKFSEPSQIKETYGPDEYNRSSCEIAVTSLGDCIAVQQELKYYKLYEMLVHPSSVKNTHFFKSVHYS